MTLQGLLFQFIWIPSEATVTCRIYAFMRQPCFYYYFQTDSNIIATIWVDVWEGVLYSVDRLQTFSGATHQLIGLNPELYQKLDFVVWSIIIAQSYFISYN